MIISLNTVVFILLIHFLGDFGLQTNDQATKKSTSEHYLFLHVGTYSLVWLIAIYAMLGNMSFTFLFAFITFICHYLTDFITSKISKKFFDANDYHNGFVTIGFDQMTHVIQLLFTYELLLTIHI